MILTTLPPSLLLSNANGPADSGFYANCGETPDRMVFRRGMPTTVLYVEDDVVDIYLMNRAMEERGDKVRLVAFRDPSEALACCRVAKEAPQLVVLDINMPRIGGLELLSRLRELPLFKFLPIVLFTTSSSELFRKEGLNVGATAYVVKPVTYEGYPGVVERVLGLVSPAHNA